MPEVRFLRISGICLHIDQKDMLSERIPQYVSNEQRAGSLRRTVPASVTVIAIASVAVITAAGCSVAGTVPVII